MSTNHKLLVDRLDWSAFIITIVCVLFLIGCYIYAIEFNSSKLDRQRHELKWKIENAPNNYERDKYIFELKSLEARELGYPLKEK